MGGLVSVCTPSMATIALSTTALSMKDASAIIKEHAILAVMEPSIANGSEPSHRFHKLPTPQMWPRRASLGPVLVTGLSLEKRASKFTALCQDGITSVKWDLASLTTGTTSGSTAQITLNALDMGNVTTRLVMLRSSLGSDSGLIRTTFRHL